MTLDLFTGRYKMQRSENFDEYLKTIGMNEFWRKEICAASPLLCAEGVFDSSSETWILKASVGPASWETSFKIGVPFEEKLLDGRVGKAIMHQSNDNVLVEEVTFDNGTMATITRAYSTSGVEVTFKSGDVVATQIYERVE